MADPTLTTEDTANPLRAILIAVVVLIAVALAVFFFNPTHTADLTVPKVELFTPHTEFTAMAGPSGTHIIGQPAASEDDLYVIATIRLEDKLRIPLFISYITASMLNPDGTESTATVIPTADIPNLEVTFPAITPMLPHPLLNGAQIEPKSAGEGQVLLLFPNIKRKSWETRKSASLTVNLVHQDPITAPLK